MIIKGSNLINTLFQYRKLLTTSLVCIGLLFLFQGDLLAQRGQGTMEVAERDETTGEATRFNFNFTSDELKNLFEYLAQETDLTIIASESDIQGKRFALINLQNVTLDEVIEHVKTVLARYNLTFVRSNSTLIVTTFDKATVMNVPIKRITPDPEQVEMTDEIQTYIIQLENASASEQAAALKPLLNSQANIFADATTNALVITEVSSNVHRIVSILQFADEGERFPLKIAIVPLTYADATVLEQTLTKVLEDNNEDNNSARGTNDMDLEQIKQAIEQGIGIELIDGMIKVYADANSNSLIIKATEENITILKEIILHLDKAPTLSTEIRTYHLEYAIAEDVATTLDQIIVGESSESNRGRFDREDMFRLRRERQERGMTTNLFQGIVGLVNITHDDRLNIVFISSDPRNYPLIEMVIKELDQKQTENEFKMYLLEFADAATLKENLTQLFEGEDTGGSSNRYWWDWDSRSSSSNQDTGFGVQGTVRIVEDVRLNALLISTSAQNFPMIDDLIEKLDVNLPDQEWSSRIFYLEHADAENLSNLINTHYQGNSDDGFRGGSSYSYYRYYLPQRQNTNPTQGALAGNVAAQPLASHNALVISTGTKRNFELIEDFIKKLDIPTPPAMQEVTQVIRLEYATADSLAQVLAQVWQDPQEQEGGGFGFRFFFSDSRGNEEESTDINSLDGKVTVFADPDTNSLIVTTRRRYIDQVRELIKKLDFVRGQVRIDIKILEVTLDETTKLGIEMAANERRLAGLELSPDNPLIGDTNAQLGLGQEISGFNYSLATKEYVALLHTLIRENKVKTLSTPTITTRDSRPATWSSGRRIPYLQSVDTNSILGDTATQPLFNYDFIDPPVGINISLTPYIARSQAGEDGKRTIGLDITNISASNFIEFTDFNAPITDDNTLSAYVDIEDGQQLIVGGIIRKTQKQVENKVPILGDIPLLGRLFKSTETEVQDTEIVFIITPHIFDLQQPEDIKKQKEIADDWKKNGMKKLEESAK